MKTKNGIDYEMVTEINSSWKEYDQSVAKCHLLNYAAVFISKKHKLPIDNEYELEEIYEDYKKRKE